MRRPSFLQEFTGNPPIVKGAELWAAKHTKVCVGDGWVGCQRRKGKGTYVIYIFKIAGFH